MVVVLNHRCCWKHRDLVPCRALRRAVPRAVPCLVPCAVPCRAVPLKIMNTSAVPCRALCRAVPRRRIYVNGGRGHRRGSTPSSAACCEVTLPARQALTRCARSHRQDRVSPSILVDAILYEAEVFDETRYLCFKACLRALGTTGNSSGSKVFRVEARSSKRVVTAEQSSAPSCGRRQGERCRW